MRRLEPCAFEPLAWSKGQRLRARGSRLEARGERLFEARGREPCGQRPEAFRRQPQCVALSPEPLSDTACVHAAHAQVHACRPARGGAAGRGADETGAPPEHTRLLYVGRRRLRARPRLFRHRVWAESSGSGLWQEVEAAGCSGAVWAWRLRASWPNARGQRLEARGSRPKDNGQRPTARGYRV